MTTALKQNETHTRIGNWQFVYGSSDNATDDQSSTKLMLTWRRVFLLSKKAEKKNEKQM